MKGSVTRSILCLAIVAFLFVSCSGGTVLRTEQVQEKSFSGPFDVTLFSRNDYDRLLTVAILDIAGDGYEITPFDAAFNFKVVKNVEGENAFNSAVDFIKGHPNFINYLIIKIFDEKGSSIGYEIRPLYHPTTYGVSDVMRNFYKLTGDGKVLAYISLQDQVRRLFEQRRR